MDNNDTPKNERNSRYMEAAGPHVPASDYPFSHCVKLQIRFSDIDILGHVNNNAYMSMLDLGKITYYADALGDRLDFHDIRAVVVNISCDFLAPTYITENIEVWTATMRIGQRSFTIEQRIINSDTGEQKCRAVTTLCGFDPASGQGAPLDPEWVDAIEAFERRPMKHADKPNNRD